MILKMKYTLLISLSLLFFFNAFSQTLTLQDALNIATKYSYNIKVAKNNVDIAAINNSYGVAGGLPLVNATATDNQQLTSIRQEYSNPANNKSSSNASSNNLNAALNASELIFNGGRVVSAKRRLEVTESQAHQILDSKTLGVIYNVVLKYYDIVRQQSYAKTLQTSIDVSKQKLEIVKSQQSVGMANNADLFQAQVDLNTQIQNLQAQQLVIDQDKTDLLTLLTLKPDSAVNISDTIIVDRTMKLDSILNAVATNPDIAAANQQIMINQFLEREVAAQRYPSLSFGAGYNFNHTKNAAGFSLLNQSYGPYAGVTLFVPIFNGNIYRKQQEIAGINTKNSSILKDTLVLSYTANTIKSWQAYTNNLQQLETAKANYDLSGQLLNLVLQRFQYRQATIVDVRNAQQSFENAGFLLVNISYAAKAAEVQLKRLANRLVY